MRANLADCCWATSCAAALVVASCLREDFDAEARMAGRRRGLGGVAPAGEGSLDLLGRGEFVRPRADRDKLDKVEG